MQLIRSLSVVAFLCAPLVALAAEQKPNVIVIVSDDQGWGDVGFNGCTDIPTPSLDSIAESGIVFDAGYASHPYCSPSRAGLLTGRYQQRFGHECNPGVGQYDEASGLPLTETLLSEVLRAGGYRTAAIGKWHLGDAERFWPIHRGFDEWFGFSGGGFSYWGTLGKKSPLQGVLRNGKIVPASELTYLTDDFSTEAVEFVQRNKDQPFFVYLAYNAPHAPDQATRAHLQKTEHIEYGGRAVYGAMVAGMDEGIGRVVDRLKLLGLYSNTLIFFYSDNGGRKEHARSFPYRGHKGMLFEGGIRVPFCMSWPQKIKGGNRYEKPISALDIFSTVLSACGINTPKDLHLSGVNLLPYVNGEETDDPHQAMYWRYAVGDNRYGYAVRKGRWKLVDSFYKGRRLLFDLDADPYEHHDLAQSHPQVARELAQMLRKWDEKNIAPRWTDTHGENVRREEDNRQTMIDAASRGEKE